MTILSDAVAITNSVTRGLKMQATVTLQHYTGSDAYGTKTYTAATPLQAIVEWKQKQLRTPEGVLSVSRASVGFLDINELLAATNNEGVDDSDIIVLPGGETGPILDMSGFIDAGPHNIPVATEVWLG